MSRYLIQCDWDSVPHLTQEAKESLWNSLPAYQRDCRSKGIPVLGSGAIYPLSSDEYTINDIEIPPHWPRAYGFDVGWQVSAAVFGSLDRETDTLYLYSEHYRKEAEPVIHAEAIKNRGAWIKGAIDPAADSRNQIDGRNMLEMYENLGLNLVQADNAVESGIFNVWTRLSSGRLKIFRSLQNLLGEMRLYRRDEKGRVIKQFDHCCDAMRYMVMELHSILSTAPAKKEKQQHSYMTSSGLSTGWMG